MLLTRRRIWMFSMGALAAIVAGALSCNGKRRDDSMYKEPAEAQSTKERIEKSARSFAEKKGWQSSQYRIEHKPRRPDGKYVVHLMYLDDIRNAVPGGGESVEIFFDPQNFEVVEVYHFQ